jgi:NAD(P)-dependent dehydrogenase (short-subunit alcohol dehydrogenase family)
MPEIRSRRWERTVLEGRVAVITGASRGIGRALAERLHAEGVALALTARSGDQLAAFRDELSGRAGAPVLTIPGDVADPGHARRVVAEAEAQLGGIDLLVNNAGVVEAEERPLWEADVDGWWQAVTVNLRGPMLFSAAVVPGMLVRGSGRIVNLNSMRAVRSMATQTAYGTSKAAVSQLTESLDKGLAGTGVRAFSFSPGRVRTAMTDALGLGGMPADAWTPMEQAVEGFLAIARGELDGLSGRFLHADDDLAALAAQAEDLVGAQARVLTFAEAYPGDHLRARPIGR